MSQVIANPERRDLPKNNNPPIVETSKLISLCAKNIGYDRYILNKCHTDPSFTYDYLTFPFITLKVQDIHYLFSKSIPFILFAILFFKVPTWSTRFSHPKVTTLGKQLFESSSSRRVLIPKVSWVVTFGTFRASQSQYHSHNSLFLFDIYPVFWAIKTILLYKCQLIYSVVMRCLYKQSNDYLKRQNAFWLNINKKLRTNQVFKSFILIIMVISQSTLFTFHIFLVTTAAVHIINDLNDLSVQKWRSCGLTEEKEISKLIIYCLNFRVF